MMRTTRVITLKKIGYLMMLILAFSCDNVEDCFQRSDTVVQQNIEVPSFNKILVNRDIQLILSQGTENSVLVETNQNLIHDIEVKVVENQLLLKNNNECAFFRDNYITKVYISTTTKLKEIRTSSQHAIISDGVIHADSLELISENYYDKNMLVVGDFKLEINTNLLKVSSNGISTFYISGHTEKLIVQFWAGDSRFEGEKLLANDVIVYHRGTNDMTLYPIRSITGKILSTGNVYCLNKPQDIDIQESYKGRVIFN